MSEWVSEAMAHKTPYNLQAPSKAKPTGTHR